VQHHFLGFYVTFLEKCTCNILKVAWDSTQLVADFFLFGENIDYMT